MGRGFYQSRDETILRDERARGREKKIARVVPKIDLFFRVRAALHELSLHRRHISAYVSNKRANGRWRKKEKGKYNPAGCLTTFLNAVKNQTRIEIFPNPANCTGDNLWRWQSSKGTHRRVPSRSKELVTKVEETYESLRAASPGRASPVQLGTKHRDENSGDQAEYQRF